MTKDYVPATELNVYERVERLAVYLRVMVSHADDRTFPGDEYLSEIDLFLVEMAK